MTAILLRHPALLRDTEEAYAGLDLPPGLARVRDEILNSEGRTTLESDALLAHLNASGLGAELAAILGSALPLPPGAKPDAMPADAEKEWWHLFGMMRGLSRLEAEVAEAAQAYAREQTEAAQRRLIGLCSARLELVGLDID